MHYRSSSNKRYVPEETNQQKWHKSYEICSCTIFLNSVPLKMTPPPLGTVLNITNWRHPWYLLKGSKYMPTKNMLSAKDNIYVQLQQKNKHWDMSMYVSFSENKTKYLYIRCKEQTLNISIQKTCIHVMVKISQVLFVTFSRNNDTYTVSFVSSSFYVGLWARSKLWLRLADQRQRCDAKDSKDCENKDEPVIFMWSKNRLVFPRVVFYKAACKLREYTTYILHILYIYIDRRGPSIHISPK